MHETSLVRDLVAKAVAEAERHGAASVASVEVRVGALSGISEGVLRSQFDHAVAGTSLAAARLDVILGPDGVEALSDEQAGHVVLTGLEVEEV